MLYRDILHFLVKIDRMAYMIIYQLTNKLNGKSYIGQTIGTLKQRLRSHLDKRSKSMAIHKALKKYGVSGFDCKVLLYCNDKEEAHFYETSLIAKLGTLVPNGYNILAGGQGNVHTEATKAKMRANSGTRGKTPWNKGIPMSEEAKKLLSEKNSGNTHTLEAIEKIRLSSTGRRHTEESKKKISKTHMGMTHSPETLEKIRAKRRGVATRPKGFTHTDETKNKISLKTKGAKHSKAAKQKISAASFRMWESRMANG